MEVQSQVFHDPLKYSLIRLMANSCPLKVSCHVFIAHEISRESFSWQFHGSWKSCPCFHGPWNVSCHVFMENTWVIKWNGSIFMENSWPWIQPWNLFCSFHGIFIQLCFIVIGDKRQNAKQTLKKADCQIVTARPCGLMFDPSPLKDNPTRLEIDKGRSVYTQPLPFSPYRPRQHPVENTLIA